MSIRTHKTISRVVESKQLASIIDNDTVQRYYNILYDVYICYTIGSKVDSKSGKPNTHTHTNTHYTYRKYLIYIITTAIHT